MRGCHHKGGEPHSRLERLGGKATNQRRRRWHKGQGEAVACGQEEEAVHGRGRRQCMGGGGSARAGEAAAHGQGGGGGARAMGGSHAGVPK